MKKLLILLGLTAFSSITMADVNISAYQFTNVAKVEISNTEAEDLYDVLQVKEKPKFKCIRSRSTGAQGTSSICVEYAKNPYKFEKEIPGVLCTKFLKSESMKCQFSGDSFSNLLNGNEVLLSNSRGNNISNSAAPYFNHLPNSTFRTRNEILEIRCETLVRGRYFDCFVRIEAESTKVNVDLNQRVVVKGKKLLNGEFRRQLYEFGEGGNEFFIAKGLINTISQPVESILSKKPEGLSFTIAQRGLDDSFIHPIIYNLTGELLNVERRRSRFDKNRINTVLVFKLDDQFLEKLSDSMPLTIQNINKVNSILGESDTLNYKSILKLNVIDNKLEALAEFILN